MNLFQKKMFKTHSGNEDIETLAYIISKKTLFCGVFGIPTGGIRIADALKKYKNKKAYRYLIVDDVLTTGNSVEKYRQECYYKAEVVGVVLFARGECPNWVYPVFQLIF